MLIPILLSAVTFSVFGGFFAAIISWIVVVIQQDVVNVDLLQYYLLIGIAVGLLFLYINSSKSKNEHWKSILMKNSKQLTVFREVSTTMQQTNKLKRILQIILTSVTAGHGLGFNRAMILLIDEKTQKLNGILGIGPMTPEEGYKSGEKISKNKYRLVDLIEIQEEDEVLDPELNERVRINEVRTKMY